MEALLQLRLCQGQGQAGPSCLRMLGQLQAPWCRGYAQGWHTGSAYVPQMM
jgi:hypothetical protein